MLGYYIGKASNFDKRWASHIQELKKNTHRNILLQRAWNKYGKENFKFYILEFVRDKNLLIKREQFWLDQSKCSVRGIGYNLNPKADSNLGRIVSEETRRRLSIAGGKTKGIKLSEEHKRKLSIAHKGKIPSAEAKVNMSKSQRKRRENEANGLGNSIGQL